LAAFLTGDSGDEGVGGDDDENRAVTLKIEIAFVVLLSCRAVFIPRIPIIPHISRMHSD
jgi:hypothetical protein